MPARTYDLHITSGATSASRLNVAADINQWFTGVQIQPGETRSQDFNLRLGQAQVQVLEAVGKPADEKHLSFYIVRQGEHTCSKSVLNASAINEVQALLPVGVYELIPDYSGTALNRLGPIGTPFEVKEGQTVAQTFNLKLAHIQVQVSDSSGQPIKFERLRIAALPAGKREVREYFSYVASLSPTDVIVQAGIPYDLEISLDGHQKIVLTGQALNEGETRTLSFKEADFK